MTVRDIDRGWKKIKEQIKLMDNSHVDVGVLSDAGNYGTKGGNINIADVATFNEYGTSRIPSRPFIRTTFDAKKNETFKFIAKLKDLIFAGKETTAGALELLGIFYQGKIRKMFVDGAWEPNADYTEQRKNSSQPLIDTGRLRQSINYEVKLK